MLSDRALAVLFEELDEYSNELVELVDEDDGGYTVPHKAFFHVSEV